MGARGTHSCHQGLAWYLTPLLCTKMVLAGKTVDGKVVSKLQSLLVRHYYMGLWIMPFIPLRPSFFHPAVLVRKLTEAIEVSYYLSN